MRAIVSEKGQVTIPKGLRDRLGIRPGEVLEFSEERGKLVASKAAPKDPIACVYGRFPSTKSTDHRLAELRGEAELP